MATPDNPLLTTTAPVQRDGLCDVALAATNDGLMDWDLRRGVIFYSERWKALLGHEDAELVSTPSLWRELTHPDDLLEVEALLLEHFENLWPLSHRWRMRHKNGDWRWLLCRGKTLPDEAGTSSRFVGVFSDITDVVALERGLAALMRRIELLLSSADEGFLGVDEGATITFANPAAAKLLGQPRETLVGRKVASVFGHGCAGDRPCEPTSCPILKPFANGGVHRVSNGSCARADGACFTADYVSTPACEEGRVVGAVVTFRDVTERQRLEAQRHQGQKLEAIGQLAAGVAHEINTPMQYIGDNVAYMKTAFADLLQLGETYRAILRDTDPTHVATGRVAAANEEADLTYLSAAIPKAIASAVDGINRVRSIVNAMKEFSHPGATAKAAADLNRAVQSTLTISSHIWKHAATIDLDLDPSLPFVACHVGEIDQVILNLVVNAAHAIADAPKSTTDALGVIRIETGLKDGFAEVRIADTGAGIPEAVRHRIFEPFFTTKEVGRGTGQGLALAYATIVEKHGGYLRFVTETGRGTTFTLGLPLEASA